jgi:3-oxoacyl-[acyl-carrier-protein] synthase-1
MTAPLILTSTTTVNACGRGLDETMAALRGGRSGLRPCDFDGVALDTFIGRVPGVEDAPVAPALAQFECRNNRLAQMALETDGFAAAVAAAAGRYGPERIAVIMGSSTSGVGEGEAAYRDRDPASARRGESIYAFYPRTVFGGFRSAAAPCPPASISPPPTTSIRCPVSSAPI